MNVSGLIFRHLFTPFPFITELTIPSKPGLMMQWQLMSCADSCLIDQTGSGK